MVVFPFSKAVPRADQAESIFSQTRCSRCYGCNTVMAAPPIMWSSRTLPQGDWTYCHGWPRTFASSSIRSQWFPYLYRQIRPLTWKNIEYAAFSHIWADGLVTRLIIFGRYARSRDLEVLRANRLCGLQLQEAHQKRGSWLIPYAFQSS